jgi:hypothetical protein
MGRHGGLCYYTSLGSKVAREMLRAGDYDNAVGKWVAETKRRWNDSKFVKLWEEEQKAGRDP